MSKYLVKIIAVASGVFLLIFGGNFIYRNVIKGDANKLLNELKSIASKDALSLDRGKVLGASLDYEVYSGVLTSDGSYSLLQILDGKIKNGVFDGQITAKMPDGELIAGGYTNTIPEFTLADGKNSPASVIEPAMTVIKLKSGEYLALKITRGEIKSGRLTGITEARTVDSGNLLYLAIAGHRIEEGYITPTSAYVSPATRIYTFIVLTEIGLRYQSLSGAVDSNKVLAAETGSPSKVSVYNFDSNFLFADPGTGAYHVLGGVGTGGAPSNPAVAAQINQIITQTPSLATTPSLVSPNLSYLLLGPGSIDTSMIQDASITAAKIATGTITADKLAAGVVTSSTSTTTVSDGAITTAKLADSAVTSAKISDGTVTTTDLSSTLSFSSSALLDLSAVTHSSTSQMGLILPNVSSSSPSNPSSGKGYLAYDTADKQVLFYNGTAWGTVGSGTITSVTAGNGLSGGGSSGAISLSINSTDISSCTSSSTQKIIWDSTNNRFTCGTDQTTGGSASSLSSITAALSSNTISNGDFAQIWNWSLTTASKTAFKFGESAASTATGTPYILGVSTLTGSTANPLLVTAGGTSNGIKVDTTGLLSAIGTGGIQATTLGGATFAAPGAIGGTTPGAGAFTTLSATGAITGATTTNTINGLVINSGALSGITTINASGQITSTVSTGTAPLVIASTTNIANLNASSLNGATFAAPGAIGGTTPGTGAFTSLSATTLSTTSYATMSASLALGNTNAAAGPGHLNISGNLTTGGSISAPTATNTINGLIINSGALSGISTITTSGAINGATISGGTLSGGTHSGTAISGTGSFTITGGTAASETLTFISTSNVTKGDIQFFSSANKITSAGALTIAGALSASNFSGSSSGTNTGDQTITLTGDVTGTGTGSFATTIGSGAVTLGKMANLAANSIIGNNTGISATPLALTASQVKTLLAIANTDVSGLGTISTQNSNAVTITGGSINGTTVGATTPGTGAFTTLSGTTLSTTSYATVSASLALGNTNAAAGPGHLNISGNLTTGGPISAPTATNTINGLIVNSGALSGITTINASGQITSTLATGTAPFVVASTTNVANLNASSLGGATFAAPGAIGGGTPSTGAFTTLSATGAITGPTATNTINGIIINAGALSGISTITTSGVINGATISGGNISGGTLSGTALTGTGAFTVNTTGNANGLTLNTATGASGNSGAITIQTGGTSVSGTSGNIAIDVGAGVGGNGTIGIGTANSGTITIGRSTQGITLPGFTGNNAVLYGTTGTGVLASATTSTSGLCLISGAATGYVPTWTTCPGGGGSWSQLTAPSADLSLAMAATHTTFTWGGNTGAGLDMFKLTDNATNTGTGYVLNVAQVAGSAAKPLKVTQGANILIDTTSTGALTLTSAGAATWGTTTGNLTIQVAGAATSANVQIGAGGGGSATPDFLVVDQATGALPAGTNGAIALDSTGKFNIYEGAWKVLCNKTDLGCGTGTGAALSAITAATAGNTINNGDNAQVWNWSLTTLNKTAFSFGENVASTATGAPYILGISTLTGSTANPLLVTAGGTSNGIKVDTTGLLQAIGTGGIKATTLGGATFAAPGAIGGTTPGTGAFTTLSATGAITAPTTTNTINSLVINAGALSGITTINASGQITSTLATGTAPFVVASTTNVANLNASSLNGATFSAPGVIGGGTPAAGTFTSLSATTLSTTSYATVSASLALGNTNAAAGPGHLNMSGNLTLAGAISGATATNTINGIIINSGAVSGVSTLGLTGAITGATATNTINGLIINSGALSGITTINTSGQFTSTLVTGTAPFVVASTTNVANLNASSLNGATFAAPGAIGGGTPGSGAFTTISASGLISANAGLTLAANQNLTFTSGTGTVTQNYSNTTGTANTLNVTNSGSSGTNTVIGKTIAITGTINGTGSNTTTGINFANVAAATNNTYNGITFGTGFNNYLTSGTVNLTAAGALSGLTTLGLSGAITGATATNTINGIIINSGAVSGVSTLGLSGAITGATATNTINGLIISSGALSGITTINASGQFTSTLATGTAPFVVASTTNVANLNASSLNGATFAAPGAIGGGTPGSGAFTTLSASGLVSANGGLTLAANQNLTLTSGTGAITQGYTNSVTGSAHPLTLTNSNASITAANVKGLDLSLVGAANANANANTITGINFGNVTPIANNAFNGITFGTGFNNFLTSGTINVTAAGAITGATGVTLASGNFDQSASAGTFSTGTGAVSLNGLTTLAAGKALIITGGAGSPTATTGTVWYDTTANKFKIVENGVVKILCNTTDLACGAGGGSALSGISAATAGNTINNGDNAQVWNWQLSTAAKTAFSFSENLASINGAGSQYILGVSTLTGSTANPLIVTAGGTANGIKVDTTGLLSAVGTGGIRATDLAAGTYANALTLSSATNSITVGTLTATGGSINGTTVGATTPSTGAFTTLSATGAITGPTVTNTINGVIISSGAVSGVTTLSASGLISANGGLTLAANQGLTFTSGTGTLTQNYSNTTGTQATFNHTNSASTGTNISKVLGLAITGTANTLGSNTITGIDFANVVAATNNTYYALSFGTGLTDILRYNGTQIISGTGVLQSAGLSGTYSNALTLSGATNSITVGTLTATGGSINGTTVGATTPGTGAFTTLSASGALSANGGLTVAANQGLTFTSGTGTLTQSYSNTTGTQATFNHTNSASTGTNTSTVLGLAITGTANALGSNTITGLNFPNVVTATNNTYNGITFGTGFNNYLTSGTVNLTAAGALSGVTTLGLSGAITGATATNTINGLVINSGALSNATTLALSGAITAATATNTINGIIINAGAVSGVSTLGLSGAITGATATNTINGVIINAGAVSGVTTLSASSTVTIGSGGNTYTFNPAAAPALAGTARPTRKVTLSPEFAGAVLTGTGTGTMTSDFCAASALGSLPATNIGVCNTAGDTHNYYNWATTQGTAQSYDIWIKWRVPDNFSSWAASNPIKVYAKTNDITNGQVKLYIYDTGNTVETNANGANMSTSATAWVQTSVASLGGTYTAGSFMTIRVNMNAAATTGVSQVGEITLDYLSNN